MSSLEITLDEFVTKIPLCQVDASWENIVNALYSSSRDLIAIVDSDFYPLGILGSNQILAAIADNSSTLGNMQQKIPKSFSKTVLPPQANQLRTLLSPITTLSSQIEIPDLILLFNNQKSSISEQTYLIVDETGKVQGILDIPKLLKHITQGNTTAEPKIERQSFSHHLEEIRFVEHKTCFTLLEQIPLPLVLYNASGNICYQNSAWNKHIELRQQCIELCDVNDPTDFHLRSSTRRVSAKEPRTQNPEHGAGQDTELGKSRIKREGSPHPKGYRDK